ncbi:MAG: hypothetical protein ABIR11_13805 [Candidatus Limnocylindrales bacterium]
MSLEAADHAAVALRRRTFVLRSLCVLVIVLLLADLMRSWMEWLPTRFRLGIDFQLYVEATHRWLGGGTFYEPYQVAGPYMVEHGAILYPPFSIPLFAAFTVLPAVLWWLVPVVSVAAVTLWHRPSLVAWLGIVFCLWFPATSVKVITGNPVLWAVAAVALGTVGGWPAVGALLKPTLFPFALIGIRRRSWWVGLFALGLLSMLFLPLWPDYVQVIRNAQTPEGVLYSVQEAPMMAIPIVAWLGGIRFKRQPQT